MSKAREDKDKDCIVGIKNVRNAKQAMLKRQELLGKLWQ